MELYRAPNVGVHECNQVQAFLGADQRTFSQTLKPAWKSGFFSPTQIQHHSCTYSPLKSTSSPFWPEDNQTLTLCSTTSTSVKNSDSSHMAFNITQKISLQSTAGAGKLHGARQLHPGAVLGTQARCCTRTPIKHPDPLKSMVIPGDFPVITWYGEKQESITEEASPSLLPGPSTPHCRQESMGRGGPEPAHPQCSLHQNTSVSSFLNNEIVNVSILSLLSKQFTKRCS